MTLRLLAQIASVSAFVITGFYVFLSLPGNLHGPDVERRQYRATLIQIAVILPLCIMIQKLPQLLVNELFPATAILITPAFYIASTGLRFGANTLHHPLSRGRVAKAIGLITTASILAIAIFIIFVRIT